VLSVHAEGGSLAVGYAAHVTYLHNASPVPVEAALLRPERVFADMGTEHFTGRAWLIRQIDSFIAANRHGHVRIEGDAGVGKTALAAWLAKSRGLPCHFSRSSAGGLATARRNLAAQLIVRFAMTEFAGEVPPWAETPDGFMVLLDSAAAKARAESEPRPLVMIIDGLDEIDPRPTAEPLGLAGPLPDGVFVVATFRAGAAPAPAEGPFIPLIIDPMDDRNLTDMREFLAEVTTRDTAVSAALAVGGYSAGTFSELLVTACRGVWVYLRYVLDEIRFGSRTCGDLDSLPVGLWNFYLRQMQRWEQDSIAQPYLPAVLSTLAALREPLGAEALGRLVGAGAEVVENLCDGLLRPFLAVDSGRVPRYAIHHASLREFVAGTVPSDGSESRHPYQWETTARRQRRAATAAHCRIADSYVEVFGGLEDNGGMAALAADPGLAAASDGGYGLRHLPRHLLLAGRAADLHRLLRRSVPDSGGRMVNLWFAMHQRGSSVSEYLADVHLARQEAEAATDMEMAAGYPAHSLGLEFRYALLVAAVQAADDAVSADDLVHLAGLQMWNPAKTLAHARRLSRPAGQGAALAGLAPLLTEHLVPQAYDAANSLTDAAARAKALAAISARLTGGQREEALRRAGEAAHAVAEPMSRALALLQLARDLPAERARPIWDETLGLFAETFLAWRRPHARALVEVAEHVSPELQAQAWKLAIDTCFRFVEETDRFASALPALASAVPSNLLPVLLDEAFDSGFLDAGAESIVSLAPHLSGKLLAQAIEKTGSRFPEIYRAQAMAALIARMPPGPDRSALLDQEIGFAEAVTGGTQRARAILALVPLAPEQQRLVMVERALAARGKPPLGTIPDCDVATAVRHLPESRQTAVLEELMSRGASAFDAHTVSIVAQHLSQSGLNWLLQSLLATPGPEQGSQLLALIPYLPEATQEETLGLALDIIGPRPQLTDSLRLAEIPRHLLPIVLSRKGAAVADAGDDVELGAALISLIPELPREAREAMVPGEVRAACALGGAGDRATALAKLVPLADERSRRHVLERALEALVPVLDEHWITAPLLRELCRWLPEELMPSVIEFAQSGEAGHVWIKPVILVALAPRLPADLIPAALATAKSTWDYAGVLTAVAPRLSAEKLVAAHTDAATIRPAAEAVRALVDTIHLLPVRQRESAGRRALSAARALQRGPARAQAQLRLVPYLPPRRRHTAVIQALKAVRNEHWNAGEGIRDELRSAVSSLSEKTLEGALMWGLATSAPHCRVLALKMLGPHLTPALLAQALNAVSLLRGEYPDARSEPLAALAPHLSPELARRAASIAGEIEYAGHRCYPLSALAGRLPAEERRTAQINALATVKHAHHDDDRLRALAVLVPQLPDDLLADALGCVVTMTESASRAQGITELAPRLTGSLLEHALAAAIGLEARDRPRALVAIAPRGITNAQAERLTHALCAAVSPGAAYYLLHEVSIPWLGTDTLIPAMTYAATQGPEAVTLILRTAKRRAATATPAFTASLLRIAVRQTTRAANVQASKALLGVLAETGGPSAVNEYISAINDVCSWWPRKTSQSTSP
jgi:hypothetical protein